MNVARLVNYSGTVQGVGFRYTTLQLAQGLAVGGYVRNLPDGTVELHVEGPIEEVEQLLARVAQRMGAYIVDSSIEETEPHGLHQFVIAR